MSVPQVNGQQKQTSFWAKENVKTAALITAAIVLVAGCIFLAIMARSASNQVAANWQQLDKMPVYKNWVDLLNQTELLNLIKIAGITGSALCGVGFVALVANALYKKWQSGRPPEPFDAAKTLWKQRLTTALAIACIAGFITLYALAVVKLTQSGSKQISWRAYYENQYACLFKALNYGIGAVGLLAAGGLFLSQRLGYMIDRAKEKQRKAKEVEMQKTMVQEMQPLLTANSKLCHEPA